MHTSHFQGLYWQLDISKKWWVFFLIIHYKREKPWSVYQMLEYWALLFEVWLIPIVGKLQLTKCPPTPPLSQYKWEVSVDWSLNLSVYYSVILMSNNDAVMLTRPRFALTFFKQLQPFLKLLHSEIFVLFVSYICCVCLLSGPSYLYWLWWTKPWRL